MKKERRERNFRILEFRENQYDIIGDVHGCYDELIQLVEKLGYREEKGIYVHPDKRRLISVGDVSDKGPANLVLRSGRSQADHCGCMPAAAALSFQKTVLFFLSVD